jgi:hypothetical protein
MRSFCIAFGLALSVCTSAVAQAPTSPPAANQELTPDQKGYIAYDQCMMHAAIRVSHTDAPDEAIFGLAKSECASTRAQVIIGQQSNRQFLDALDAADADKAAHFPAWIRSVRERREAMEAQRNAKPPTPMTAPRP